MTYKSQTTDEQDTELAALFDDWMVQQPEETQIKIGGWIDRIIERCHKQNKQIAPRGAKVAIAHTLMVMQPAVFNQREK